MNEKIIFDTPEGKFLIIHKDAITADELCELARHIGIIKDDAL